MDHDGRGDDAHEASGEAMAMSTPQDDDDDMPPLVDQPSHSLVNPDEDEDDEGDLPIVTLSSSTSTGFTFIADPSGSENGSGSMSSSAFAVPFHAGSQGREEMGGVEGKIKFSQVEERPQASLPPPPEDLEGHGSDGYIPRPPNAFILFRSSFIRSQKISGKVEGNHSTLSKIIGKYWRQLPPSERAEWEAKAKIAQAEHREKYPDWRFRLNGSGRPSSGAGGGRGGGRSRGRGGGRRARGRLKSSGRGGGDVGGSVDAGGEELDEVEDEDNEKTPTKKSVKSKGKGKGKAKATPEDLTPTGKSAHRLRTRKPLVRDRTTSSIPSSMDDRRIQRITELLIQGMQGADLERELERWEEQERGDTGGASQAPSQDGPHVQRERTPPLDEAYVDIPSSTDTSSTDSTSNPVSSAPMPIRDASSSSLAEGSDTALNTRFFDPRTSDSISSNFRPGSDAPHSHTWGPLTSGAGFHSHTQGSQSREGNTSASRSWTVPSTSPGYPFPGIHLNTNVPADASASHPPQDESEDDVDTETEKARAGGDWFLGVGSSPASSGSYTSASPERGEVVETGFSLGENGNSDGASGTIPAGSDVVALTDEQVPLPPLARRSLSAPAPARQSPSPLMDVDADAGWGQLRNQPVYTRSPLPMTPQSPPPQSPYPSDVDADSVWCQGQRQLYTISSSGSVPALQSPTTPQSPPSSSPFLSPTSAVPPQSPQCASPLSPFSPSDARSPREARTSVHPYPPHLQHPHHLPHHSHSSPTLRSPFLQHRQSMSSLHANPNLTRHNRSRSTHAHYNPTSPSRIDRRRGSIAFPIQPQRSPSLVQPEAGPEAEMWQNQNQSVWELGHAIPVINTQSVELGYDSTTATSTMTWTNTDPSPTWGPLPFRVGVVRTSTDPYLFREYDQEREGADSFREEPVYSNYSSLSGWAGTGADSVGVVVGEEVREIPIQEVPRPTAFLQRGVGVETGWDPTMLDRDFPRER
ncbi:hypothetical protein WG66_004257 [Moniliophthora roreri]|nr:hypothetical protein WG66_004257 [Moniliophthora roreri]